MYKPTLLLGLLSSAFAVETTTLLLIGFDNQSINARVLSADSTATTYKLSCPPNSDCGVPPNFSITQGPSTMHYSYDIAATATMEAGCDITSDHGDCSTTWSSSGETTTKDTFSYSDFGTELGAQAVTIVGAAASSRSGTAKTTATTKDSSCPRASSTASTTVSTGGMPAVTGKAQWVVGGAAAAAVFAAM